MRPLLFCIFISCMFFSCQKNELNYIPEVATRPENIQLNQGFVEQRMNLEGIFSDKDGEPLQISALSNAIEVVDTKIEGTELVISEKGNGNTKITLRATDSMGDYTETNFSVAVTPPYLRFAVLSDLHYMDESLLGSTGSAIQIEKNQNPLMFERSGIIIPQTIEMIASNFQPRVLVLNGDLTKDGSLVSHQAIITQLENASKLGMRVLVIPGARDINNFNASRYSGDNKTSVPSISVEKFKTLYHNFGYDIAFSQDHNSLSYACEPQKGIYVLMLDTNQYEENSDSSPYNDKSKLKPETIEWIKTIIEQAKDERKTILTFMHGSFLETFEGEATHFPEHLMENANEVANTLANLGLKVVFTGHNHVQDITEYISEEGNKITQVETGSLLAYPNPFRIIELKTNQQLSIKSKKFSEFYMGSEEANFESTSKSEFSKHYSVYINNILSSRFNVSGDLLTIGTNSATEVGCIHSKGDEARPDDNSWIGIGMLKGNNGSIREAGVMLEKMDTDKFPPDNNFTLYLSGN